MVDFHGKVGVVTGGAQGIGAGIVELLAQHGATVASFDKNERDETHRARLDASGLAVMDQRVDITDQTVVKRVVEDVAASFGRIDFLVNCAGIFPRGTLLETDDALWNRVMDVNLKAAFYCCKAVVPFMMQQGGGAIINVGSVNAVGGMTNLFAYSTSKGGLLTMTKNLARGLAKDGIRVNCVHPGWVVTEGERVVQRAEGEPDDWAELAAEKMPFGKMLTAEDIAPTVVFLLSDGASQVTGQSITVDGGLTLNV